MLSLEPGYHNGYDSKFDQPVQLLEVFNRHLKLIN